MTSHLLLRRGDLLVARCLEYDIVAQGRTLEATLQAWADVFTAQILSDRERGKTPLEDVAPAPKRIQRLFKEAKHLASVLPKDIPEPWMIEAMRSWESKTTCV